MVVYIVLDFLRWRDGGWILAGYAGPQLPCPSLPPGLFLDETVRMVRFEGRIEVRNTTRPLTKVYYRCSFTFDPENFPDPKAYLAEIKRKYGVKVCVWSKSHFSIHRTRNAS